MKFKQEFVSSNEKVDSWISSSPGSIIAKFIYYAKTILIKQTDSFYLVIYKSFQSHFFDMYHIAICVLQNWSIWIMQTSAQIYSTLDLKLVEWWQVRRLFVWIYGMRGSRRLWTKFLNILDCFLWYQIGMYNRSNKDCLWQIFRHCVIKFAYLKWNERSAYGFWGYALCTTTVTLW